MLYQLLDSVCSRIDKLDADIEAPRFAAQVRKMRPTFETELKTKGIAEDQLEKTILVLSAAQVMVIKGIPAIAGEMRNMLQSGRGEPAFRCVLAASLAYFVQPRDLLSDDLPGGYGFVDDALLLHEACALSWEITGDRARADEKRKIFQFVFMAVPDGSREQFQSAISGLAMTLNIMRSLDPMMAEMTTNMLIANPLQPIAPRGEAGAARVPSTFGSQFTNYPGIGRPQYSWRDGNTMGVNFPGGGGVATDGRSVFVL